MRTFILTSVILILITIKSSLCLNETCISNFDCLDSACCKNKICVNSDTCRKDITNSYIAIGCVGILFLLGTFIYFFVMMKETRENVRKIREKQS